MVGQCFRGVSIVSSQNSINPLWPLQMLMNQKPTIRRVDPDLQYSIPLTFANSWSSTMEGDVGLPGLDISVPSSISSDCAIPLICVKTGSPDRKRMRAEARG